MASLRKIDLRRHPRYPASGSFSILCETRPGSETILRAQLVEVSVKGLRLLLDRPLPVRSLVFCNSTPHGISGRGSVRYCRPEKGKYMVGLEFSAGTGWRGASTAASSSVA